MRPVVDAVIAFAATVQGALSVWSSIVKTKKYEYFFHPTSLFQ